MRHHIVATLVIALIASAATGCSAPSRTGAEIDILLDYAMRDSTERMAQGDALESYRLARAVAEIDPKYPGVQEAIVGMPADLHRLFDGNLMGSNVSIRQPIDAAWYEYVLWYVPDRILDALDVFSFDLHMGLGLWIDAHATRAAQLSVGTRAVGGIGWHNNRSLGFQTQTQAGFSVLPFGVEGYSALRAGTSGLDAGSWSESGLHNPTSRIYADYKDYWAVGGGATILFVGVDADIHPLQIFDFFVGFFLFDPLNDDFGSTTGVELSQRERQLMLALSEIASKKAEIEDYYIWRGMQEREAEIEPAAAATPLAVPVKDPVEDPAPEPPAAADDSGTDDGPETDDDGQGDNPDDG